MEIADLYIRNSSVDVVFDTGKEWYSVECRDGSIKPSSNERKTLYHFTSDQRREMCIQATFMYQLVFG